MQEQGSPHAAPGAGEAELRPVFEHAAALHAQGRLDEAARTYRQVLVQAPDMPEALNNLGSILRQQKDLPGAEALFRRATTLRPDYAEAWHNLGLVQAGRGQRGPAFRSFTRALALRPDHGPSLAQRGQLHVDDGNDEDALADWIEAARVMPRNTGVRNARALLLHKLGRLDEAVAAYQESLAIDPGHALALHNVGAILRLRERHQESLPYYQKALAADPGMVLAHAGIAEALRALGRHTEAADHLFQALRIEPTHTALHNALANALYGLFKQGRHAKAQALARQWVALYPDDPVAQHVGRAMAGEQAPDRASDAYVKHVFDTFADTFDEVLGELDYRAPQAIAAAIAPLLAGRGDLAVLDAGCGTGLAARLLRPFAAELIGVDLSARMLERARERGLYDRLEEAEITAWLDAHPGCCDLVFAADVLIYFGEIDAVIATAARALRPRGLLAFTVEKLDGPEGIAMNPHGRYAHSAAVLRAAVAGAGLELVRLEEEVLRRESARPVIGWLVVARRAA